MKENNSLVDNHPKWVLAGIVAAVAAGYFYWSDQDDKKRFSRRVEHSIRTAAALKKPADVREINTKDGHLYELSFNTDPMGIGFIEKQTCFLWANKSLGDGAQATLASMSCISKTEHYLPEETR